MNTMGLADTIYALRARGYVEDFNLEKNALKNQDGNFWAFGDAFVVDQVFRFDVMSDPGDQAVLYAIRSTKTGSKGILVNGFGIYTDAVTNSKIQALQRWENDGGKTFLSDSEKTL